MSKTARSAEFFALVFLLCTSALWAQIARPMPPQVGPRRRIEPCWQQAGISKSAMQERAAIARETRSQLESVCANTSLTPQQRQQEIRQIHQAAKQKLETLISPSQQQALHACQQQRAAGHPSGSGVHRGSGMGPCGELPANTAGHPNAGGQRPQNENPLTDEDQEPQP